MKARRAVLILTLIGVRTAQTALDKQNGAISDAVRFWPIWWFWTSVPAFIGVVVIDVVGNLSNLHT